MTFFSKDKEQNIWNKCFKNPAKECDALHFLSAYFRVKMVEEIRKINAQCQIKGIYGMACEEGMSEEDITSAKDDIYLPTEERIFHEKLYVWLKDEKPIYAFVGSANFTHKGCLGREQSEVLYKVEEPEEAHDYLQLFDEKIKRLSKINEQEREDLVNKYRSNQHIRDDNHKEKKSRVRITQEGPTMPELIAECFYENDKNGNKPITTKDIARWVEDNHPASYNDNTRAEIGSYFSKYFNPDKSKGYGYREKGLRKALERVFGEKYITIEKGDESGFYRIKAQS